MRAMARPPPTRPHIAINPSTRFSSYASVEWAQDDSDAWDSASDSESPSAKSMYRKASMSRAISESSSAARPVPRPRKSPSNSSLTFSYTHVNAPSPSSYSPKLEQTRSPKTGWTMVTKSGEVVSHTNASKVAEVNSDVQRKASDDFDIEDIVIGDMDAEASESKLQKSGAVKNLLKKEAKGILQGI